MRRPAPSEAIASLAKPPPACRRTRWRRRTTSCKWIDDDHFTFLGYREYDFSGDWTRTRRSSITAEQRPGRAARRRGVDLRRPAQFRAAAAGSAHFLRQPRPLMITKANRRATVHRTGAYGHHRPEEVRRQWRGGRRALFVGLFTSVAYSQSPHDIPLLRQQGGDVQTRAGFAPASHDGKALQHILETYPARRAVPGQRGRALRVQPGHPASAGAAAHRAVRPARSLRALRLLPRLCAARPLQHRSAPAHPGDPGARLQRHASPRSTPI